MLLALDQLDAHLAKSLAPLYLIYGDATDEPLLALEAADKLRATARAQGFTERDVMMTERSFDWGSLREASASLSLFGGKKFIDLRIPNGKPGIEGGAALAALAEDLARDKMAKDVLALVTLPQMDWKSQQTSWFQKLQGKAVTIPVQAVGRQELPRWIALRLSRQNQRVEQEALRFIAERVEGNLLAAHQEIQKLGLLYPEGELSIAQVTDAVLNVARYDVFKLNQAMLSGDSARLARMLGGLKAEGEAPPLVLWAMTDEIRLLARVLAASGGRDVDSAMRDLRVSRGRQGPIEAAARHVTLAAARGALRHAARVDRMIKGLARGDVWDELLQLGLRFSK